MGRRRSPGRGLVVANREGIAEGVAKPDFTFIKDNLQWASATTHQR